MRYFIHLSFRGDRFHGWQVQPDAPSVQETLNTMLSRVVGEPIETVGAGRTDAGVHATGMWAHFDVVQPIKEVDDVVYKLNRYPEPDVAIHAIKPVHPEAHARFSATSRKYIYKAHLGRNPFLSGLSWELPARVPDVNRLNSYAQNLLLIQDFASFARSERSPGTDLCNLMESTWILENNQLFYHVRANRFLRNMVRALVGTQMELERNGAPADSILEVARHKNRSLAGTSAPACGLYLTDVTYPNTVFDV